MNSLHARYLPYRYGTRYLPVRTYLTISGIGLKWMGDPAYLAHECRRAAAPSLPASGWLTHLPHPAHAALANVIHFRPDQVPYRTSRLPFGSLGTVRYLPYLPIGFMRRRIRRSVSISRYGTYRTIRFLNCYMYFRFRYLTMWYGRYFFNS